MDFCPFGGLNDLSGHFAYENEAIPEPAIWSIFNDLVDAGLLLQFGGVEEEDRLMEWEPIVHRDLKLENVWLDYGDGSRFPSYPVARVGDFGVSIMTDEDDPVNPTMYNDGSGTVCWRAPEQILYLDRTTLVPIPERLMQLGHATNVWGIGAIIMRLMNRQPNPAGPKYIGGKPETPNFNARGREYSKPLRELVEKCVQFKPEDRPNLRDVRVQILAWTRTDADNDLAEGMRSRKHELSDDHLVLQHQADRDHTRLGLAVDANELEWK